MGPLALDIDIIFWFCSYLGVFSTILSLFRYVIWTFCCTGNKEFMKVYQCFIGHQILKFEICISLSPGPKAVLFRHAKFLLEALVGDNIA
jgi:hypothetical protein